MRGTWRLLLVTGVACATLLGGTGVPDRAASQPPGKPTVTVYKSPT